MTPFETFIPPRSSGETKYRQCKKKRCTRAWPAGEIAGSCPCGGDLTRPIIRCHHCGSRGPSKCLTDGRCMYAKGGS